MERSKRQPFFTEALPCECCGEPCDELVYSEKCGCLTGKQCACNIPEIEITCPQLQAIYSDSAPRTIGELNAEIHAHEAICPECRPPIERKEISREDRAADERRRIA